MVSCAANILISNCSQQKRANCENLKTNQERNEIEWQKLELEKRKLNLKKGTEPQRYISPDHEYEEPIYERKGEKSKNTYHKRTMEMFDHHGQYENENTEDRVETKTCNKNIYASKL